VTRLHIRQRLRAGLLAFSEPPTATIHLRPGSGTEEVEVEHSMHPHVLARRLRLIADRLERTS
jgi:hypothetical protein